MSVSNSVVEMGKEVVRAEANALKTLADQLPSDFESVVSKILENQGRVIVCGVGKSGHVGRKIAATLASTGTPSFFVHPTEASHGDLGMITRDDVCILISNSGETAELTDLVAYTRRHGILLIAISSVQDSSLMRAADLHLNLPAFDEACLIGLAPTTSTTLTLALGDALAVVLMRLRNITPQHFRDFHPGGKLGAQLSTVGQIMHKGTALLLVKEKDAMTDALIEMTSKGFGVAGVMKASELVGVISDGDLRRNMTSLFERTASQVATKQPIVVSEDTLAVEALKIMNVAGITSLFVVDDSHRVLGLVNIHDLLRLGLS